MENIKHFKPKAHILKLLGEELIKSPIMAIYELVKNSYDADSSFVDVHFNDIQDKDYASITVVDNGTGLTSDVIENVWLEPGTDHRKPIDDDGNRIVNRSPIYDRVPMGEKGVGRFAVHKLGNVITLVTRPATIVEDSKGNKEKVILDYEITLSIDWKSFSQSKYLEDIPITWQTEKDSSKFHFKDDSGTLIKVTSLKEPWTRRMARALKRNVVSMLSPKNNEEDFKINLQFGNQWLENLPSAKEILDIAPAKFTALLDDDYNLTFDYSYSMSLDEKFGIRKLEDETLNIRGSLIPQIRKELEEELLTKEEIEEQLEILKTRKNPFGNIWFELYTFELDSATLKSYTYDTKTTKDIVKLHSGIKVFKDEMRVFDYGSPKNDWLELDIRRVNSKSWMSNNQNIGYLYLDAESSSGLIETTNREGFIDNIVYKIFYQSVVGVLNVYKTERWKDRQKWLDYISPAPKPKEYKDQTAAFKELVDSTDFSDEEKKKKLKDEAESLQKDFEEKKETLLIPAGVGMTASVALHEIEKLVPRLRSVINNKPFKSVLGNEKVDELEDYVQGILSVLRKGGNKPINLKESINTAISNYSFKLKTRKIDIAKVFDDSIETIKCDKRYFITVVMNIIDNSIHWLDTIYKDEKGIYFKTYLEDDFVSILIVDNGPGFKDEITDLVRPFFSRKDDGIGIGLYLIDTIMMKYGKLEIIENSELGDIGVPDKYRGAAIKLTFSKNQ